jgi:hypothetical protein
VSTACFYYCEVDSIGRSKFSGLASYISLSLISHEPCRHDGGFCGHASVNSLAPEDVVSLLLSETPMISMHLTYP